MNNLDRRNWAWILAAVVVVFIIGAALYPRTQVKTTPQTPGPCRSRSSPV